MDKTEYEQLLKHHPEMAKYVEYVEGDSRRPEGYWRLIPKTRFKPAITQKMWRLKFSETAHKLYDKNLKRQPYIDEMKKQLKGKWVAPSKMEKIFKNMAKALKEIGVVVEKRAERKEKATA